MKTRYKPTTTTKTIEVQELGIEVYINENDLVAIGYSGRRTKRDFGYRFSTKERMDEYVKDYIDGIQSEKDRKKAYKEERRKKAHEAKQNVKVGDIYVASWGYSMTLVNAYQVVSRTAAMVTLREIDTETVSGEELYSGNVKPIKDSFRNEKTLKKRISDCIKINSSQYAYKWDGKRDYYFNRMD